MARQCNHKFKNDEKCGTPHIYEDTLKQAFIEAFNRVVKNKAEILQNYETVIQTLTDTTALDREIAKLQSESDVAFELLRKCVEENAHTILDQKEYQQRYGKLIERYEVAKNKLADINEKRLERTAKRECIQGFMRTLEQNDILLTEFDEGLWNAMVDTVKVNTDSKIAFTFRDGFELNR